MSVRARYLPPGWYPGTEAETRRQVRQYLSSLPEIESQEPAATAGLAGIVPHAGWDFSGRIALDVLRRLEPGIETVVVAGGHLSPREGIYAAPEEEFETPLGNMEADGEMLAALRDLMPLQTDRFPDNTVEIQLPFIKYLFPDARLVYLRAAPSSAAVQLGKRLSRVAGELKRRAALVGSTDLTHYGAAYGFMPHGSGKEAVRWVKDVNDKKMIDAFLAMDTDAAVRLAETDRSACSVGGAAAAMAFAAERGVAAGRLIRYMTSWDVAPAPSFVGYAGILYA